MNNSWTTRTLRYIDRFLQRVRVRREAKGWSKTVSKKALLSQRAGYLWKSKNSSQRNRQYYNIHHIDFKRTLEICFLRLSRKTKISDYNFFVNTNHDRGSLESTFTTNVNLVILTKFHGHWKILKSACKQSLPQVSSITTAAFTIKMLSVNLC